jgi:hypothetical protein
MGTGQIPTIHRVTSKTTKTRRPLPLSQKKLGADESVFFGPMTREKYGMQPPLSTALSKIFGLFLLGRNQPIPEQICTFVEFPVVSATKRDNYFR